jgi:hypothetical protein
MLTATVVEVDEMSPLHELNMYLEVSAVTFDGFAAVIVTFEFGEYQALGVAVPPFEFTVSKYCVAYTACSIVLEVMET